MHTLNATFEVSSPMFIAGYENSSGSAALDIRPTAIKGALRFWWRALHYAQFRKNAGTQQQALKSMHAAEMQLFGSAAGVGAGSGQSLVLLRICRNIQDTDIVKKEADQAKNTNGNKVGAYPGCRYFLGMGLCKDSKITRAYIKTNAIFEMQLSFKPAVSEEQIQQVKQALLAFGLLGNLGARARKGFGSVSITQLKENGQPLPLPTTKDDYIKQLRSLFSLGETLEHLPPFSAFSAFSQCDVSVVGADPVKVLNEVGEKQQRYRGYGENSSGEHKVNSQPSLQLFSDDHDELYHYVRDNQIPKQPRRLVFGLPHNVRFTHAGAVNIEIAEKTTARRASPLLIHIHRIGNEYLAVQSLIAAQFFPEDAELKYDKKVGSRTLQPKPVQWQVITDYLILPRYQGVNHSCDGFISRMPVFKGSKL
jgi:CRISPR-associated protein Cmr1